MVYLRTFLFFQILIFHPALADSITEDTSLNFGTIALKDNLAQYNLRVALNGQITNDDAIVILSPGYPAQFSLTGFPANTLITISVSPAAGDTQLAGFTNPSSSQFQVHNFETLSPFNTDANGEKTFTMGATLTTSGIGSYMDAMYIIFIDVTASY